MLALHLCMLTIAPLSLTLEVCLKHLTCFTVGVFAMVMSDYSIHGEAYNLKPGHSFACASCHRFPTQSKHYSLLRNISYCMQFYHNRASPEPERTQCLSMLNQLEGQN